MLVSGIARGGVPEQVVDLGLRGHFVMVTSRPLLDELARVLQYPKLAPLFEDPLSTVLLIERAGVVVEPTVRWISSIPARQPGAGGRADRARRLHRDRGRASS